MEHEVINVVLSENAEADIIREVIDSDVCQHFIKKRAVLYAAVCADT